MNPELPLACSLTAPELRQRGAEITVLADQCTGVEELADGYALVFAADAGTARALFDFVLAERECCPFFTFTLRLPSPHQALWLNIQGSEGVKEMIASSGFASAIARSQ